MFPERLKLLRKQANLSQKDLANIFFVSQQAVGKWESGRSYPSAELMPKIADYFDVPIDYLFGDNVSSKNKGVKIPVLDNVQAGIPVGAFEEILDYEEITPRMARTGEFFGLRIRGSSMEPRFTEGDVIIVRQQPDCDTGDIAVVMVNSDDATVKKIKKTAAGITLIPTNPAFDPLFYSWEEVEQLPVRILGKVVELRAKF